ncbi:glycosyltransferase family protein, partial [Arthrobacter globiformis]|uniref:glycosyltransferase family protein n=1 Tax=Arthrobacter globiformis TaxID=1665 RepID=UPI001124DBBC
MDAGLVEDVRIYSLLWRLRAGEGKAAVDGLLAAVKSFAPDVVLMQHLGSTGLDGAYFSELRRLGNFRFIYHEADPYSRWKHPLPSEAKAAGGAADVVFTVGRGAFRSNFIRSGSRDVRWCPSIYDPGRFGRSIIPHELKRPYDVVMIANKSKARTPFTGHPNSRQREELVRLLCRRFGKRFAIFGRGWTNASAKGPVPYSEQDAAIHAGWVSTNWDHYSSEEAYFSDRLPTTLATGSVHVTTYHKGFDEIFMGSDRFLRFGRSPKEIVDVVDDILATHDRTSLVDDAQSGRQFADMHFRQDDQFVTMLNFE